MRLLDAARRRGRGGPSEVMARFHAVRASARPSGLLNEERAQLRPALDEGIEQMKAGQTIDVAEAMAELRAHR